MTQPLRTIQIRSEVPSASRPQVRNRGMADLVWYQGETVRVLCSFQALGLPVAVDPDFSVKLLGWQGSDLSTLFIDRAGTIITGPGGYVQIDLPPNLSSMDAGAYQVQIKVYDPTGTDMGIGLSGVAQVLASPDNTAIFDGPFTEVDWTNVDEYTGTATHGPVRPHSGTLEVKATNGDGSISIGVKDGLYDPAGAAAAAQAAAEAASLPVGGTAADVNPAGTAIAAALLAKANLAGGNTFDASAQILAVLQALASTGMLVRDSAGNLILTIGNQTPGARALRVEGVIETSGGSLLGSTVTAGTNVNVGGLTTPAGILRPGAADELVVESARANANLVLRGRTSAAPTGKIVIGGLGEAVELPDLTASRPLALDASKNVVSPTAADFRASIEGQRTPVVNSSSITAVLDTVYHGTAAATYTDPTPAEGRGYLVRVVNGTQTVGGIGYAAEGTVIFREYHSGAWRNRVLFGGADAAGVRANIGLPPATEAEMRAGTVTDPRAMSPANAMAAAQVAASSPYAYTYQFSTGGWTLSATAPATCITQNNREIEFNLGTAGLVAQAHTFTALQIPGPSNSNRAINWARPFLLSFSIRNGSSAGAFWKFQIGTQNSTDTNYTLTDAGVAFEFNREAGEAYLKAHNGTTLTTSAAITGLPTGGGAMYYGTIYSDGAGNVSLWLNNGIFGIATPTATITGGPTAARTAGVDTIKMNVDRGTANSANLVVQLQNLKTVGL